MIFTNFQNRACREKYLKDIKHYSLHLEQKYVRRFVLVHYLFLGAHRFSRALTLSKKLFACRNNVFLRQSRLVFIYPEK